jgi:hypothetical protein
VLRRDKRNKYGEIETRRAGKSHSPIGRTSCLIDSRRSDWEEKVQEDNTRENMDEVENYVKKIIVIFFQNALRKEQEQFIERRYPC